MDIFWNYTMGKKAALEASSELLVQIAQQCLAALMIRHVCISDVYLFYSPHTLRVSSVFGTAEET